MLEYGSRKTWRRWMADRWVNTGLELVFIHERCKMQYIQRNVVPHLGRIGKGRSRNLRDNKHCIELTSPGRLLWSGLDSLNTRVVNQLANAQRITWCERSYDTSIILLATFNLQVSKFSFAAGLKSRSLPFFFFFCRYGTDHSDTQCHSHVSNYIKHISDSPAQIHGALSYMDI